ncbi:MAG TPA: glycosyltransferase family 4 protein [Acidimicrobiales bacterium]|jgi:glycosyltransferase involved in cell wall biosynthesis|nr:glycosyltransferase family 4 protein [Acidimicrobiales bacterium]
MSRVLIVVENMSVPRDRRVWRECQALTAEGVGVSVVCPRAPGEALHEVLDGVSIHRYDLRASDGSPLGFAREFASALWHTARLTLRVGRTEGFDVLQACNPPDVFFVLGAVVRLLGKRFVFDHHDLAPELYESRFGRRDAVWRVLRLLERATFATADHVVSTNESYRAVALGRGRQRPDRVTVVRNGPEDDWMRRAAPSPELLGRWQRLCVWYGVMGAQDGVDLAVEAARVVVQELGRDDVGFAFLGDGDQLEPMRARVAALGLDDNVRFTGWVGDEEATAYLSTAHVGLCPDPPSPLNDVSTMVKSMEYMAFGLPIVAFDLPETRTTAADAAVYASGADPADLAKRTVALLDDEERRARMASAGRTRIEEQLAWRHQRRAYVELYRGLLGG